MLIKHGAGVNNVEVDGWPPLMLACQQGHRGVFEVLIENGADIHLREKDGATALWLAAQQGHAELGSQSATQSRSAAAEGCDLGSRPNPPGRAEWSSRGGEASRAMGCCHR